MQLVQVGLHFECGYNKIFLLRKFTYIGKNIIQVAKWPGKEKNN